MNTTLIVFQQSRTFRTNVENVSYSVTLERGEFEFFGYDQRYSNFVLNL